jgi:hypothetical protein
MGLGWPCTCMNISVDPCINGCREGSGGWMGMRGTSADAFGCWEEDGKGLGVIGLVSDKQ